MSIYNSVEIARLSSEVENIKQKQEFLIEDMMEIKEDMKEHNRRMKHITESFEEIKNMASVIQYENLLMMMTSLFRSEIREKRDMVLRMAEGIYKGLSGTLSPAIMNPSDLMPTLQRLKDAASKTTIQTFKLNDVPYL